MSEFNNGDVTDVLDSFFIDYAIDEDDDEANVQELMQQRSDMSEAVNEWYAKAKVLDRVKEFAEKPPFLLANNENEDYERYAYDQILKLINKYESGGSE